MAADRASAQAIAQRSAVGRRSDALDVVRHLAAAPMTALLILCSAPAWAQDVTPIARVKRAVVVRSAPDASSPPIGRLAPGDAAALDDADLPG